MNLWKKIHFAWLFYRGFIISSLLISACCLNLFWLYGFSIFTIIVWFKIATLGVTFYFINEYKKKEYYYFYNRGLSKIFLWASTLSFDIIFFLFLVVQLNKFR